MFGQPIGLGSNPSEFRHKKPKTESKISSISPGDLYMMQTKFERAQSRIRNEGKKMDNETEASSKEHFGQCTDECKK